MSNSSNASERRLRIVHVLRSPVGGLFRHVLDLAREQRARGHDVGLIADTTTGGERADAVLQSVAADLALGVARFPMRRDPHPADAVALLRVGAMLRRAAPDVIHGHGAKGALYVRVPALLPFRRGGPVRVYTPHGGSLHYDPRSLKGAAILGIERLLAHRTDMIFFESAYAAERFRATIGPPPCPVRIVHNGLAAGEFVPVEPQPDAADFLYVGELRMLKGVDVLLDALAIMGQRTGRAPSAVLVGSGPDRERFEAQAAALGLADRVTFRSAMPAREAFALGRVLVVPSRAESLPYIVLEAAAARLPVIASRVGGIPEILGTGQGGAMVPPGDATLLSAAMLEQWDRSPAERRNGATALAASIRDRFSADRMSDAVLAGYRDALTGPRGPTRATAHQRPTSPRYGL